MHTELASFKLSGLLSYLTTRIKLRFFDKVNSHIAKKAVVMFGQPVALDLLDLEQKYLAVDCVREPENLFIYRAIAHSGLVNTFIDIGANCGHVAASIMNDYSHIILFEPNPKLAILLRDVFKNYKHIEISECAIVDNASVGNMVLTVPDESSGLATLGATSLSLQHEQVHTYTIKASTLAAEVVNYSVADAFIKIDVEGFEANIIESAIGLIQSERPIVGFEALSIEAAKKGAALFNNYIFYCARFDFLENGGALTKSVFGILKALLFGASIKVLKFSKIEDIQLSNFSQIFSVPIEKTELFEKSILSYASKQAYFDLKNLKTWS